MLLEAGRLLSTAGTASTTIAYPLLVLAATLRPRRPARRHVRRRLPPVRALRAGRRGRRRPLEPQRLMIAADGVRALAIASLAATILLHRLAFWQVIAVAFVEGAAPSSWRHRGRRAALGRAAAPAADGRRRAAGARVDGAARRTAAGRALFGLGRAVPFLVDAVSYAFSILSLLAMRTPFQEREVTRRRCSHVDPRASALWSRPFLRTCALIYGLGNFAMRAAARDRGRGHAEGTRAARSARDRGVRRLHSRRLARLAALPSGSRCGRSCSWSCGRGSAPWPSSSGERS